MGQPEPSLSRHLQPRELNPGQNRPFVPLSSVCLDVLISGFPSCWRPQTFKREKEGRGKRAGSVTWSANHGSHKSRRLAYLVCWKEPVTEASCREERRKYFVTLGIWKVPLSAAGLRAFSGPISEIGIIPFGGTSTPRMPSTSHREGGHLMTHCYRPPVKRTGRETSRRDDRASHPLVIKITFLFWWEKEMDRKRPEMKPPVQGNGGNTRT